MLSDFIGSTAGLAVKGALVAAFLSCTLQKIAITARGLKIVDRI